MAEERVRSSSVDDPLERTKYRNRDSIAYLKRRARESATGTSIQHHPSTLPPIQNVNVAVAPAEEDEHWRPEVDYDEDTPLDATDTNKEMEARFAARAKKVMARSDAHEKEKNKENLDQRKHFGPAKPKPRAFVDPQDRAERVTWDASQTSTRERHDDRTKKRRPQPRVEVEEMSDPSQDESFQHNNNPGDISTRRKIAPTAIRRLPPSPPPAKEPTSGHPRDAHLSPSPDSSDSESEADSIERQPRQEVDRHNRSSLADPPSRSQARIAEEQRRINRIAKNKVRAQGLPKVQTRRPWSEEETSVLIEYIMEHGTSYAYIKQLDEDDQNILEGRDQVALKDKARNIKTDYLKAGKELPPNFDRIPLNKALKDKLRSIGITYNDQTGLADYDDD